MQIHFNPSVGQLLLGVWAVLTALIALFHILPGGPWDVILVVLLGIAGVLLIIGR